MARNTVTKWIQRQARALPPLSETVTPPEEPEAAVLELDEMWSFVGSKQGPVWVWIALCRATRQVAAWVLGDRSAETCLRLWAALPELWRRATCYTDFYDAYQKVVPEGQHAAVGKGSGKTAHVERFNNTVRQRLGRFVRKTLSFSQSDLMHDYCLRLFLHEYNLSLANTRV